MVADGSLPGNAVPVVRDEVAAGNAAIKAVGAGLAEIDPGFVCGAATAPPAAIPTVTKATSRPVNSPWSFFPFMAIGGG
jgi:hypothetical protein